MYTQEEIRMLFLLSGTTNPYFNLATEEYLMRNKEDDIFYLYRNDPSIIVGTNQNTLSEINYDYVKEQDLPVVRRLSGGGAVFHDLGNLNFCFISNATDNSEKSFKAFTTPILEALQLLGVDAKFSGRNDLTIEDKKFSGNAQHFYKNRILHHGTLLFSSNMADLSKALKPKNIKFEGKSVKSVRSRVTNISSHLKKDMEITEFVKHIMDYIKEKESTQSLYTLSPKEVNIINELVDTKYSNWDWTYGKSPDYSLYKAIRYEGGTVDYHFNVKDGFITDLKIFGDFFNKEPIKTIEKALKGVQHEEGKIKAILSAYSLSDYLKGIDLDTFVTGLF